MNSISTGKKIINNIIFIFLGDSLGAILHLILTVFLVRFLGEIDFGKYAFALAFTSLFIIFTDLGLSVLSIREIARALKGVDKYLINVLVIKIILSIITIPLLIITVNLMNLPKDKTLCVYIFGVFMICLSFIGFFRSIFRAFQKMQYEMFIKISERILILGFVMIVLLLNYRLIETVIVTLGAEFIVLLLAILIILKKFAKFTKKIDFSFSKNLIKKALPFGIATIFATIYFRIDTVMISLIKGDAPVGWYNAAYQLVWGTLLIPTAFVGSVFPVFSQYFTTSKDKLKNSYEKSFKLLIAIAIPLGIGTTILANKIIIPLFGKNFSNSIIALQILIWVATLCFPCFIVAHVLASIDKQGVDTLIAGISALINILLNLLLIPKYSYVGAGIASVISQLFMLTCEFFYLQNHGYKIKLSKIIIKPLGAGTIMGISIYFLKSIISNLFVTIFIGFLIYTILILKLKEFNNEELSLAKNIFRFFGKKEFVR